MSNFMTRRFTLREKILLGVLIVIFLIGLYFFLVHYPIQNRLREIDLEKADVAESLAIAQARKNKYDEMQADLEEIFKMPDDEITYMPKYDNLDVLMTHFNAILFGTEKRLNFGSISRNNGIVSREISFYFVAQDYENAKNILSQLTGTGFRCLMTSVTLSPGSGDIASSTLTVSANITFYELDK